jgi:hypothetical protein
MRNERDRLAVCRYEVTGIYGFARCALDKHDHDLPICATSPSR